MKIKDKMLYKAYMAAHDLVSGDENIYTAASSIHALKSPAGIVAGLGLIASDRRYHPEARAKAKIILGILICE